MFITLLLVTFLIALLVSYLAVRIFTLPIENILKKIIDDEISAGWLQYLKFAIYVVGISSGVRIYELERYITPSPFDKNSQVVQLNLDRWVLEIYRTIIETLQGIAWLLLIFFIFALIAYVIVKIFGKRNQPNE